jgi:hypothetical protein
MDPPALPLSYSCVYLRLFWLVEPWRLQTGKNLRITSKYQRKRWRRGFHPQLRDGIGNPSSSAPANQSWGEGLKKGHSQRVNYTTPPAQRVGLEPTTWRSLNDNPLPSAHRGGRKSKEDNPLFRLSYRCKFTNVPRHCDGGIRARNWPFGP